MAHSQSLASLRAITYRVSSTPTKQLPHIAPQVAASLWACKEVLSTPRDSAKAGNEAATLVHRFRTFLSSLLQDRTIEGRWAAVVLTKAAIEAGGVEFLTKSNNWVRSLLAILKKPDPPTTRALAVITLTRIFVLTWDYSNLVREITTPALPTLIATCLNNFESKRCSTKELQTTLEAFTTLVPRHPTIFRTHESQIRTLLLSILSSSSNTVDGVCHTQPTKRAARRLLVLLHHCAPKQGSGEKWDETLRSAISAAHSICDHVFRAVVEDWTSTAGVQPIANSSALASGEVTFEGQDSAGLNAWTGIFAGADRIVELLSIVTTHIQTATATSVNVPIGLILDLLTRLCSLSVLRASDPTNANIQIPKDEREALLTVLPHIHVSSLRLTDTLLDRFGSSTLVFAQSLLDFVVGVHRSEGSDPAIRTATYTTVRAILALTGPSMTKRDIAEIAHVVRGCCNDLFSGDIRSSSALEDKINGVLNKHQATNGDSSLQASKVQSTHPTVFDEVQTAAAALLPVLFSKLNPADVSRKLRTQMEQTAILTKNKEALVACVMNPAKKNTALQTSLMPLLAREYPDSMEVEALLRPRMPVLPPSGKTTWHVHEDDLDGYEGHEDDALNGAAEDGPILDRELVEDGEPTDGLLSALTQNESSNFAGEESEEDLYSASPRRDTRNGSAEPPSGISTEALPLDSESGKKRAAEEPPDTTGSAKRLRSSSPKRTDTVVPGPSASLHGPEPTATQASFPVTAAIDQRDNGSRQPMTLPPKQQAGPSTAEMAADLGSDDSDFEIPPLTMESDTDPDDDDEEAEGEEDDAEIDTEVG